MEWLENVPQQSQKNPQYQNINLGRIELSLHQETTGTLCLLSENLWKKSYSLLAFKTCWRYIYVLEVQIKMICRILSLRLLIIWSAEPTNIQPGFFYDKKNKRRLHPDEIFLHCYFLCGKWGWRKPLSISISHKLKWETKLKAKAQITAGLAQ